MGKYDHLERNALVRLLERRDAERQPGLVWEREELDPEAAQNDDFVALEQDERLSHGDAPWQNLIIEGDNYDALRALRMSHAGRIRCIYIDPPCNTGNRDFVYNDRFVDRTHRFHHSLWREFMYKRLVLARELLADDGVIFVSIDDNELFRLGMLMDRVFGEGNFIETFSWVRTRTPAALAAKTKKVTEYVLCYERSRSGRKYRGVEKPVQSSNPLLNQPNRVARLSFPAGSVATGLPDRDFAVSLYAWDDGDGFFPDFVVGVDQRETPGGVALLEVKGQQLWGAHKEPDKAEAVHRDYWRVFIAGRRRDETEFLMLRKHGERLDSDGPFSLERLRWA